MNILLIRHTRVALNRSFCYGSSDVGLADTYSEDLEGVRERLPGDLSAYRVYSSPLKRCRQLAQDLAGDSFQTDDRLVEFSFGRWELKEWSMVDREELEAWARDRANLRVPGGDLLSEFADRCNSFFKEVIGLDDEKIALVTHNGVINAILAKTLHIPVENMFKLNIDYGGMSEISLKKEIPVVRYINR